MRMRWDWFICRSRLVSNLERRMLRSGEISCFINGTEKYPVDVEMNDWEVLERYTVLQLFTVNSSRVLLHLGAFQKYPLQQGLLVESFLTHFEACLLQILLIFNLVSHSIRLFKFSSLQPPYQCKHLWCNQWIPLNAPTKCKLKFSHIRMIRRWNQMTPRHCLFSVVAIK